MGCRAARGGTFIPATLLPPAHASGVRIILSAACPKPPTALPVEPRVCVAPAPRDLLAANRSNSDTTTIYRFLRPTPLNYLQLRHLGVVVSSEAVFSQHEVIAARTIGSQIGRALGDSSAKVGWIVFDDQHGNTWSRMWASDGSEINTLVQWPEER